MTHTEAAKVLRALADDHRQNAAILRDDGNTSYAEIEEPVAEALLAGAEALEREGWRPISEDDPDFGEQVIMGWTNKAKSIHGVGRWPGFRNLLRDKEGNETVVWDTGNGTHAMHAPDVYQPLPAPPCAGEGETA